MANKKRHLDQNEKFYLTQQPLKLIPATEVGSYKWKRTLSGFKFLDGSFHLIDPENPVSPMVEKLWADQLGAERLLFRGTVTFELEVEQDSEYDNDVSTD